MKIAAAALLLILPLAACKKEAPKGNAASGEILPGSISDAMLPEDRLTSRPPLAPHVEGKAKGKEAATDAATEEAPEPAATG